MASKYPVDNASISWYVCGAHVFRIMKQQYYGNISREERIKAEQVPNIPRVDDNRTLLQQYKQQAPAVTS